MKNYSQLNQDLWVLQKLNFKKDGFFLEAGACDGIYLSNTYLLEKEFNWKGICCEPNSQYYDKLKNNRNCHTDNRVLYDRDDGEIEFYPHGELGGTFQDFKVETNRLYERTSVSPFIAKTVSLNTLLKHYNAPKNIDYISLDTEGSELKILNSLDFSEYDVKIFSIEHNTSQRNDGGEYLKSIIYFLQNFGYKYEINQWDCFFFKD